jgi:hypothetical protein
MNSTNNTYTFIAFVFSVLGLIIYLALVYFQAKMINLSLPNT